MRKFIALGVSAISAGSIILSVGGSAVAETTTNTIVDDVCVAVPEVITSLTDAIAGYDLEAVDAAYAEAKSAAEDATEAFVVALVNYLKDVADNSANLPISTSTLQVREGQYGDALAAWSDAAIEKTNKWGELEFLTLQDSAMALLADGLACTPPVED